MKVQGLYIYPVKSCQGIAVSEMQIDEFGPKLDRQWMIVDAAGKFITQRDKPKLAKIKTQLTSEALLLDIGGSLREVPLSIEPLVTQEVQVWNSQVAAQREDDLINNLLSEFLEERVALVRFGYRSSREVMLKGQSLGLQTRFADGYPLLLANEASLEDLNSRLKSPVNISRFRPNLVVHAGEAYSEDAWTFLKSDSGLLLENVKPCARCVMVTQDQQTGESDSREVLKVLSQYRKVGTQVNFGVNLVHRTRGILRLGEELQALVSPL